MTSDGERGTRAPTASEAEEKRHGKVAIVYHFFPHYREGVMRALLASGRDFVFVAGRSDPGGDIRAVELTPDIPFVEAPGRFIGSLYFQKNLLSVALDRRLRAIIYLGDAHCVSTWMSAIMARLSGKRVLFWTHGYTRRDVGLKRHVRRVFYGLADGLLLYGPHGKTLAMEHGLATNRLHVIYNSLDYDLQKNIRESTPPSRLEARRSELFREPGRPLVLCVARLTYRKRFDLLIEAAARLDRLGHPVNVLLVGDGPERTTLENLALRRGVKARFLGECYDQRTIGELTMAADVTVVPGEAGLTAMQSLAYGTPVITHNSADHQMPEWEAVVPGKTGMFFDEGDPVSLSDAIHCLVAGDRGQDMRARCIAPIETYYNPHEQALRILRALDGQPPDDSGPNWPEDEHSGSSDPSVVPRL